MAMIKIQQSGPLTTIQDKGRYGYMQYGMMPAGAMDELSMYLANLLVGNDPTEAVIEAAYLGPTITFDADEVVAVTGARCTLSLNGEEVPMWRSLSVQAGDVLKLSPVTQGLYVYLAFSRGLDVPLIMGSKSTYLRGKLGGLEGRKLKTGDVIALGEEKRPDPGLMLDPYHLPEFKSKRILRVVLGPQDDYFTEEGITNFLSQDYTITQEADRMGYRLDGEPIAHKAGPDIISDGIAHGTVQVPGNGLPIILLSDRGTTGGYTKIATVIAPDICALVQMPPGSKLNFDAISVEEANAIYRETFGELEKYLIPIEEDAQVIAPEVSESSSVDDGFSAYEVEHDGRKYIIRVKKL
ncbi:MAG TPA: biotin-dependent carboxyltransferase family protein [Tissierellia bacterium]|nr:biotin-dependent carboxyltransferase family protein [Tissierellia bacterium]